MTVSSVDTAELPRVAAVPVVAPAAPAFDRSSTGLIDLPVLDLPAVVDFPESAAVPLADPDALVVIGPAETAAAPIDPPVPLDRLALRAERRQQRRQRRLYACLGLSVIASMLAATIVVLDVVR